MSDKSFIKLPFDIEQMVAGLRLWVETESPSYNCSVVNKVVDLAEYDLAAIGASIERVPGRMGYADTLRATYNPGGSDLPGILICCHSDTVHEVGSIDAMPYRREGNNLWGPGIAAMKSGIYLCLEALRQLARNSIIPKLPVTFVLIADKEPGCPSTRELFESTARSAKYVLVPECVDENNSLVLGRHAQERYKLDVKVDSVAGHDFSASAISEMARHIVAIDQLSTDGCSFKVGAIESGLWVNSAEKCTAKVISEALTKKDVAESIKRMMALNSPNPEEGLHVNRDVSMPLWCAGAKSQLIEVATQVGGELGLNLHASVGAGGSLGNITGSMGIETLDGLGPVGAGMRSRAERIEIDSLPVRGRLIAGLLQTLK